MLVPGLRGGLTVNVTMSDQTFLCMLDLHDYVYVLVEVLGLAGMPGPRHSVSTGRRSGFHMIDV
jgi:hypothetical protein